MSVRSPVLAWFFYSTFLKREIFNSSICWNCNEIEQNIYFSHFFSILNFTNVNDRYDSINWLNILTQKRIFDHKFIAKIRQFMFWHNIRWYFFFSIFRRQIEYSKWAVNLQPTTIYMLNLSIAFSFVDEK